MLETLPGTLDSLAIDTRVRRRLFVVREWFDVRHDRPVERNDLRALLPDLRDQDSLGEAKQILET